MRYRPSQPHGWPPAIPGQSVGMTIGGHVTAKDFSYAGRTYRIELARFGRAGTDPVRENFPTDTGVDFEATLAQAYGAHFSFRYLGRPGRRGLAVQSYSVYVDEPTDGSPLTYGADLYVVGEPDLHPGDPAFRSTLRWIQVVRTQRAGGSPRNFVDSYGRANPFHPSGGITSINGRHVLNFVYGASESPAGAVLSDHYVAEAFLVQDTGIHTAAGQEIVHVFDGIKYGWKVGELDHA
jgi:hypothetical protein